MPPEHALCTAREIAEVLRVHDSTVRKWVAEGIIKPEFTTPGGHHRFILADVMKQLAAHGTAA